MRKCTIALLALLITGFCANKAFAQHNHSSMHCVNDYVIQKTLLEREDGKQIMEALILYEKELKQMIAEIENGNYEDKTGRTDTTINGRKIIPVVVHVIHKYNSANITDEQVIDAINLMNIDYNKLNSDTDATHSYPGFASRRANIGIEFRLARINPDGICTNGIERIYDPETDFAYFSTMQAHAWSPSKYLNVYSVTFIYPDGMNIPDNAVIGGMSPFPPSNPLSVALGGGDSLIDGVLIRHDCLGSIGTATNMGGQTINYLNRTFTHEMGHYLNLYHPFQNMKLWLGFLPVVGADGCSTSGMSGLVSLDNDEVADTPPIAAASQGTAIACAAPGSINSCPNNVTGYGDEPDMIENYMDYNHGYCNNIFTTGQLTRMNATLMSDRRQLWSYENLVATGVWDTSAVSQCAPIADFMVDFDILCMNTSVNFTDMSYNAEPSSWQWTFQGGTPATSTDQNPQITYDAAGIYDVKLVVTNAFGSDSLTRSQLIYVADPAQAVVAPYVEGFESTALTPANGWIVRNENGNPWTISDSTAFSGSKCLRVQNFEGNKGGSRDELVTPIYDLSAPTSGMYKMYFDLAYVGKKIPDNALASLLYGTSTADTIYDNLQVQVSTNCGRSWLSRYTKSGMALATAGIDSIAWMPQSTNDWRNDIVILSSYTGQSNVRFKFVFKNRGGNNIYIDNINLCDGTGIPEMIDQNLDMNIYPNPVVTKSELNFNLFAPANVKVELFDIVGRKVQSIASGSMSSGPQSFIINAEKLHSGIYMLKVTIGSREYTGKLMVN
ncbi:MAG: PKD domain-containing protein [Bacteroidetes bacterium]|nr:PKD domain-containing protein [Bacteroidota bacterium]MBU1720186.1 PKD domain-containing protein [Bacteroidota bacterium]